MIHHIVDGDKLKDFFPSDDITGELIVCREALHDGPVSANSLPEFYAVRASFFENAYDKPRHNYYADVVSELQLIGTIPKGNEIRLWFYQSLPSQVNLWFMCSLLHLNGHQGTIAVVFPVSRSKKENDLMEKEDFLKAWDKKTVINETELALFSGLWQAFQSRNTHEMTNKAGRLSQKFEFLPECVQDYISG